MTYFCNGLFPGELKPSTNVGGCIDIFENAWPDPARTIQMLEAESAKPDSGVAWSKATTWGNGNKQNYRTNMAIGVSDCAMVYNNAPCQNVHNQFYMMLLAASIPYAERYSISESLYHEGYNVLKYGPGQEYKVHYDGTTSIGRIISAICYLNDDYEGGELEFPNYNVKIKPQAGMLILFPSTYPYAHVAHPVTKGNKYAIVSWIRDVPISI